MNTNYYETLDMTTETEAHSEREAAGAAMADEVTARLAEINAAVAAQLAAREAGTEGIVAEQPMTCPVDPAERALCEGCQ